MLLDRKVKIVSRKTKINSDLLTHLYTTTKQDNHINISKIYGLDGYSSDDESESANNQKVSRIRKTKPNIINNFKLEN